MAHASAFLSHLRPAAMTSSGVVFGFYSTSLFVVVAETAQGDRYVKFVLWGGQTENRNLRKSTPPYMGVGDSMLIY
jgi:hypothetical protein